MEGVVKFLFWFLSLSKIDHVTNLQLKSEEIVDLHPHRLILALLKWPKSVEKPRVGCLFYRCYFRFCLLSLILEFLSARKLLFLFWIHGVLSSPLNSTIAIVVATTVQR